ncbi:MAG: histidine phosphatase family protein [Deltaproteobacteria bacterium]|jgi:broad specificity phosphatase PhoE|nr:histidine phosphatase family protein [Deltaproteobacteria bacterium]
MSELYMIRHGQASFGEQNYDRLSDTGLVQAEIVARHWLAIGRKIDAIYVGGMKRQIDTARALISAYQVKRIPVPEIVTDASFDEYDSASVFEAQLPAMMAKNPSISDKLADIYTDKRTFQLLFEEAMNRWVSGACDVPGAVTWQGFNDRVVKGARQVMKTQGAGKSLAVFTSGGPISVMVQKALGLTGKMAMALSWQIMNASITRFKYNARGFALAGFNDITHLELENDDSLLTYR